MRFAGAAGPSANDNGTAEDEASSPAALVCPERPRFKRKPPFSWKPSPDYASEFRVTGLCSEVATKAHDFLAKEWVAPIAGTLRLARGGYYRWTIAIERMAFHRPQMQLGVHGVGHRRPYRLFTTTRLSRARDDEQWLSRPGGDRVIGEGDFVHVEVDLRGLHLPFGTLSVAVNGDAPELLFDDLPLSASMSLVPIVAMGGDGSRIRLCSAC
eukprot:TRINITY_DN17395_c0_g1_i1.p1 TRINITY_DN17395_c0_g1~~TRINITY_DN17395_c0_g1_i1.p1  ORF type:complete len:212 (-),score=35.30 TRINITY_DN17395_c0_g1_i1:84-719(-)